MITPFHYIGTFITIFIVSYLGFASTKKVKSSQDFVVGSRKLSSSKVAGSIIATIVGGASTIGTAQLAFEQGINAMWFTLGSSLACLFLGIFLAVPLRRAQVDTVSQLLSMSYGEYAGVAASIITSLAIFIHITGQVLSSIAILTSLFNVTIIVGAIITIALIISYIFFGGFLGTSVVGIMKTILLYLTLGISGILTLKYFGGVRGFTASFPRDPWFNLFSNGIGAGLGQGFSMVVGVASTQTYLQAMFAGRTEKESRKGAFISALLIPPIGLICTLIGMYMRTVNPGLVPKEALPAFILSYLNPWIGGVIIAALIISVIGTGAGLTLGVSTMVNRDIYLRFINPKAGDESQLKILRLSVFVVSALALLMVYINADSLILKWGFLSMALRGTTIFIPLIGAIFFKGRVKRKAGLLAIISAPILTIGWEIFGISSIDSLYIGLLSSFFIILIFSLSSMEVRRKVESHR
ncbi:sodium:solute symporter family protein [Maledivibacter halophilus]|uniref:Solute:Na+ symporter, SSS family n=1 Tax=Maledivibacter halophilus TaxID=36842 RepID=A0A1T5K025_9FIRM|nr:sodium:solute symporter family protein [Maledivibacter halophilus]SKC57152.1 solute:Na+ symporter, SSS family [Maledivibacter halophilus]